MSELVDLGLTEDIGHGDITTGAVLGASPVEGVGRVVAREPLVVSGLEVAEAVFRRVDSGLHVVSRASNGARLASGDVLLEVSGLCRSILVGERVALNFLGRLCGIATHTRRFVDAVAGTRARIVDTRKSTPGFRRLEKAAVRHGGGHNHRFNLSDGILIKDNHIQAAGGVRAAVEAARANRPHHLVKIEVEVDTLEQLKEALAAGAEVVMLDNMSVSQLREAVALAGGRVVLEASGGVRLENVREIAETGVDIISAGSLIHGARWVDIGLDLEADWGRAHKGGSGASGD